MRTRIIWRTMPEARFMRRATVVNIVPVAICDVSDF
jgi:hypothetical protein